MSKITPAQEIEAIAAEASDRLLSALTALASGYSASAVACVDSASVSYGSYDDDPVSTYEALDAAMEQLGDADLSREEATEVRVCLDAAYVEATRLERGVGTAWDAAKAIREAILVCDGLARSARLVAAGEPVMSMFELED